MTRVTHETFVREHEVDNLHAARKRWTLLQALFCLAGFALDRLAAERGYLIARGVWSCEVPTLRDVYEFAARAGIVLPEAPP